MKASDKLQYAADLDKDGENGATYLVKQFNKYQLKDLKDYAETEAEKNVLRRALRRAK
jgi:hypothetical protein